MSMSKRRPKSSTQLWLLEPLATLDPEFGTWVKEEGREEGSS